MKIGLICPYNIWGGGGVQECVLALHKELSAQGHNVKIITPKPSGHNGTVEDYIIVLGKAANMRTLATSNQISASIDADAIEEVLDAEKFDVLHFHEPWIPFISHQILAKSRSINVATFHAKLPETAVSKTLEKVIIPYVKTVQKYLDGITAVSPAAAEFVQSVYHNHEIKIIPNGIDLDKYRSSTSKTQVSKKTILFLGRLEKRKGVKYLLKAFAQLADQDKNVELLIAGDGPDKRKLEDWVSLYKVPRVKFLGYVDEKQKYNLLNSADLFCSPALFGESFGIVLLEAMAMGVVTVAGNNAGYTSVMKDRGRMSLVSPKDTAAFVHRLELLLYDEDIRHSWQNWAQEYVKNFDYKKVVGQYEEFYKQVLDQSKNERQ